MSERSTSELRPAPLSSKDTSELLKQNFQQLPMRENMQPLREWMHLYLIFKPTIM